MSMEEISDEELERRMRRKLFSDSPSRHVEAFTEEEKRIANKLLGRDNTELLQRQRATGQRFRPVPVRVHYEYYRVEGDQYSMDSWRIVRIENGRSIDHVWQNDDFEAEIATLKRKGYTVREFVVGAASPRSTKPGNGSRKTFAERYGPLSIGGKRR